MELESGQTYAVQLTVTNTSTKGGQPTSVTLGIGILAVTGSVINLIAKQVSQQAFGAGQTRTFNYSMAIPTEASGSTGGITAWAEDPTGKKIIQAVESIIVGPYLVTFGGLVTDAETKQPLSGATVEMRSGNILITSTTTNSEGYYQIQNIPVPATYVFAYKKSGYRDTVTDPIYLDPTGGGLNAALVPLVLTKLALYYSNPNNALATHWDVYDLDRGVWLAAGGLVKRIGEAYVFIPQDLSSLFLCFRESVNAFFDMRDYGPYVVSIAGLGEYTWNARNTTLNGVKATSLMNTSGSIRGKVLSKEETNVPGYNLLTLEVLSATGSPGDYFVGKTIKAEAQILSSLVGKEITGTLKVQATSPGNYQYYPGFVLVLSNVNLYPPFSATGTFTFGRWYWAERWVPKVDYSVSGNYPSFTIAAANILDSEGLLDAPGANGPGSGELRFYSWGVQVQVFVHPLPNRVLTYTEWKNYSAYGWRMIWRYWYAVS